ncbi:MAG: SDR family NAD(P)-dependent oxidoreductase [Candidatus Lokiarchaeota archaeon]
MLLKDKNIVITGSGRGIGKSIALASAKEGANIGLTSRSLSELEQVKNKIKKINPNLKVSIKVGDVTKYSELKEVFDFFHKELGNFNGVIANAGASGRYDTDQFTSEKFSLILDVNILGVFHTFKAAYPYFEVKNKKDKARFIITGSAAYPTAMPKLAAYTASKYGVVGFQKALAMEYRKENINFTMVLPTMVDTRLLRGEKAGTGETPPGVMTSQELDDYYLFLLSKKANRVNDELIYTLRFEQLKPIIRETVKDKKESWDIFGEYLKENNPSIYDNVKSHHRLVEFFLHRL